MPFRMGPWDLLIMLPLFLGCGYILYLIVRALRKYTSKEKDK